MFLIFWVCFNEEKKPTPVIIGLTTRPCDWSRPEPNLVQDRSGVLFTIFAGEKLRNTTENISLGESVKELMAGWLMALSKSYCGRKITRTEQNLANNLKQFCYV